MEQKSEIQSDISDSMAKQEAKARKPFRGVNKVEALIRRKYPLNFAPKPEERPTTRALKEGFISAELLTRYCKLIGHKYPDHICSKCNGEDNVIPDVQLE
ncbi:hypothetical protein MTR67_034536 [Solanum verrucosum]|uniref:Uncharacterized protein n=1 Tax=Solanum verrucosum TaxID=315347 RepID=A0AAF0U8K0_SOLVR|nr:hypothetical protein MTR67_034536 [Solanum verrucosum]